MKRKRSTLHENFHTGDESEDEETVQPQTLHRTVSPPPVLRRKETLAKSATAAVEAGEKHVEDHLGFYSQHLLAVTRPGTDGVPRLNHRTWIDLYMHNAGNDRGHHFVVHQHDHPIAGTHYDLRLQCNPTSSISFAIMYGLPGDPNSRRLNRNATETRVHCLWNHLIETASYTTGTMLLWDTGEYEILPYYQKKSGHATDESGSDVAESDPFSGLFEPQKLQQAFAERKIRLRLHGTKLPRGYTLSLRLTKDNYRPDQPKKPSRRRRRIMQTSKKQTTDTSDSESSTSAAGSKPHDQHYAASLLRTASPPRSDRTSAAEVIETDDVAAALSDGESETIRRDNAYLGAINSIGSVHQRRWYLSLDRSGSGFVKTTTKDEMGMSETTWVPRNCTDNARNDQVSSRSEPSGFNRFIVHGREVERSIVTGRLAKEVLEDEGVKGYVPRGLWRPVTE